MKSLKEKYGEWALITGASSGIGEAFTRRLAAEKISLILVARRADKLRALQAELEKSHGVKVLPVELDVGDADFLGRLVKAVNGREVGLLVNNAGFGINGYLIENDPAKEVEMLHVNCRAPLLLAHHFGRKMAAAKKGGIIFVSSIGANQPTPKNITYVATKAFDLLLGEGLAYELNGKGVDVVTVMPGATRTEFQKVGNYTQAGGMRAPEDVVRTALKALGKRFAVTDGFENKVMSFFARRLPRKWVIAMAASYIDRFSSH